jgi:hypothetical protein
MQSTDIKILVPLTIDARCRTGGDILFASCLQPTLAA